jgi:hypothetical protein
MPWLGGVDGFKDQWCIVLGNPESDEVLPPRIANFQDILNLPENPTIGLPDVTFPGGRTCDRIARGIIWGANGTRPGKASSKFKWRGHNLLTSYATICWSYFEPKAATKAIAMKRLLLTAALYTRDANAFPAFTVTPEAGTVFMNCPDGYNSDGTHDVYNDDAPR